jgi:type I restriction enzyme, S subunit
MVGTVNVNLVKGLWKLPLDWVWVKLGDILKLEYGKSLIASKRVSSGSYPVFGSSGQVGIHDSAITKSPAIIIGRKGSIGVVFFSDNPCWAIDTTYYLDEFPPYINPKYIYYFLKILGLDKLNRGAAIPGLSRDDVYAFPIPIPSANNPNYSLDIQRRIVVRLEALLDEVRACRSLINKTRQEAEKIINVALGEMAQFITHIRKPLSDVIESKPRNGWSPKCDNNPEGIPVLKLGAVLRFRYHPNEIKLTSETVDKNGHYWLNPGDILISRSNTPELVGHAAIYSGEPSPCIYPDLMMKMTIKKSKADSRFLIYWLQTQEVRDYIQSHASGASSTMKKITQSHVCNIPFPHISIEEQRQWTSYLDHIKNEVYEIIKKSEQDAKLLDYLEQSILERAFRGEL